MKEFYKKIVTFLYNNYVGVYSFKLFGKYWTAVRASRIMFPFFVIWGITKLFQVELHISYLDMVFIFLFFIQYLAGFTNVVVNEYKRLYKLQ